MRRVMPATVEPAIIGVHDAEEWDSAEVRRAVTMGG